VHHPILKDFPLFWIPLLPLLGAFWNGTQGWWTQRRFGRAAVHLPAVILPAASTVVAIWGFLVLWFGDPGTVLHDSLWAWLDIPPLRAEVAFQMDRLSAVMALVVTFVGTLIHVYSTGYMKDDPAYWRFFAYLNLFLFAMLVLVLGDNLLLMFVGWEGVGLCSYLLISFWWRDREKAKAGMKAFVVNRIGDFGFTLGVFLLFFGLMTTPARPVPPADRPGSPDVAGHLEPLPPTSVTFREIEQLLQDPSRRDLLVQRKVLGLSLVTLVCLLLFVGATGKSAQIPLYVWLPDAMAGPTPVSALIHAATMVTAGVYLVARMHFLFSLSPGAMTVVASIGALTALFAASIGLFQHDIKKVLAYSTVSQLGFMFLAVGVGAWWVGIFHLMTHAFFKACLFLGSGSVILGCHHEQDMRRMGGLRRLMPITATTYLLATAAIAGFPFFSGFFSKDEILWKAFDSGNLLLPGGGVLLWGMAAVAAFGTSYYMFRSYYLTFSGSYRGAGDHGADVASGHDADHHAPDPHGTPAEGHHGSLPHESPVSMTAVLAVLAALAVIGGLVGLPHLWHLPNFFEAWLEPVFESSAPRIVSAGHGHGWEWALMAISVALAFGGFGLARWLYRDARNPLPERLARSPNRWVRGLHRVVYHKYYVDEAYDLTAVRGALWTSRAFAWWDVQVVDRLVIWVGAIGRLLGWIGGAMDRAFVDGAVEAVGEMISGAGNRVRRWHSGRIQAYVQGIALGAVALVVVAYLLAW